MGRTNKDYEGRVREFLGAERGKRPRPKEKYVNKDWDYDEDEFEAWEEFTELATLSKNKKYTPESFIFRK